MGKGEKGKSREEGRSSYARVRFTPNWSFPHFSPFPIFPSVTPLHLGEVVRTCTSCTWPRRIGKPHSVSSTRPRRRSTSLPLCQNWAAFMSPSSQVWRAYASGESVALRTTWSSTERPKPGSKSCVCSTEHATWRRFSIKSSSRPLGTRARRSSIADSRGFAGTNRLTPQRPVRRVALNGSPCRRG